MEDNKLKTLSADALTDLVILAADTIEGWGLYAMVYTYTWYSQTELNMDRLSAYDLWIADYRANRPTRRHGMWQYTSTGRLDGIAGNVDISHAYKDYPSIIARAVLTQLRGVIPVESIVAAIVSGAVTLVGVLIANSKSQAVTDTKLEELTREVREHNNFAQRVPVLEEKMKVADHRISDLEDKLEHRT